MCRYFLKAAFNWALLFLMIVTLGGKLLKILCQHRMYFFWKPKCLSFGVWRWCLFLILILCVNDFLFNFLIIDNEAHKWNYILAWNRQSLYCLNRLLHEVLGCAPAVLLTIFFCKVNIIPLLEELPQKNYSMFYARKSVHSWLLTWCPTCIDPFYVIHTGVRKSTDYGCFHCAIKMTDTVFKSLRKAYVKHCKNSSSH